MSKPLISIITATLNRAVFIETAVNSVLNQGFDNLEHIIIDGGSTDGTLKILKKYPHLRVISEPDSGVYDAMNKGIRMARGDVIGLLNSDDFYENGSIRAAAYKFQSEKNIVAICGGARKVIQNPGGDFEPIGTYPSEWLFEPLRAATFGVPMINAWFLKKWVYEKLGFFDTRYSLAADRDFLIRFYLSKNQFHITNQVFYNYLKHPGSLTITSDLDQRKKIILEHIDLIENYISFPSPLVSGMMKKWFITMMYKELKMGLRRMDVDRFVFSFSLLITKSFRYLLKRLYGLGSFC